MPRRVNFLSSHLVVVTECFVEQGKSVVDVLGDSYRIVLRCLKLAEHLDPFPGGRLWRLPGKLGPSHVHSFQRQTSTSERNSASILLAIRAHGREVHRLSRVHYNTDVRSPTYARIHGAYTARAQTHAHGGWRMDDGGYGGRRAAQCRSLSVSLSLSLSLSPSSSLPPSLSRCWLRSVNVGRARSRSAAAAKYARTCQTGSLSYQGGLRRYTIRTRTRRRTYVPAIATTFASFARSRICDNLHFDVIAR